MYQRESDLEDFNIILFSNDSIGMFPENKLSAFTNMLARPCKLIDGLWSVGLSEIAIAEFDQTVSDEGKDFIKRKKRSSGGKLKVDVTSEDSLEFSYNDLFTISGTKGEIDFDEFLKNLDGFIISMKPLSVIKLDIRKIFDEWLVEFNRDKNKQNKFAPQKNLGAGITCKFRIYGNEIAFLNFPSTFKDMHTFLDNVILQIDVKKRSLEKFEELFDIFMVYDGLFKKSKKTVARILVPPHLSNTQQPPGNDKARNNLLNVLSAQTSTPQGTLIPAAPTVSAPQIVTPQKTPIHGASTLSTPPIVIPEPPTVSTPQQHDVSLQSAFSITPSEDGVILVYMDIISPRRIGSRNVRVLKVIDAGYQRNFQFHNIEYVPVEKNYFDSISVLLTNSEGERVPFYGGKKPTYVNLHFKKRGW